MNPETVGILTIAFAPTTPIEYILDLLDASNGLVGLEMNSVMHRYEIEIGNVTASAYETIADGLADRIGPDGFTDLVWVPNDPGAEGAGA